MFQFVLLGFVSIYFLYLIIRYITKPRTNAPGPKGWPLLGNALEFDIENLPVQMAKWVNRYGDVFKINLFGEDIVVISGELCYEALVKRGDDFAGRPIRNRGDWVTEMGEDIAFADTSPEQKKRRKIAHSGLKQYGTGMAHLEEVNAKEIKDFLKIVADKKCSPFDPRADIYKCVIKIITLLLFGEALTKEDDIKTIAELDETIVRVIGTGQGFELDHFPWLRFFGNSTYEIIKHFNTVRTRLFDRWLLGSKDTMEKGKIRGMVDWLLVSQENEPTISDTNVRMMIQNILLAGITTTESTIESGILVLMNYPDIQKKIQMSIDAELGTERFPTLDDRSNLPYVDAFILETLRYTSVGPFTLRKSTKDSKLGNYFIPKDTQVWVNMFGLHHDERYFADPWTFKPERFLDQNGDVIPVDQRKMLMPFGAGRRVCVGEQLARARLFLFFTAMLQKFTFLPHEGDKCPSCDPRGYTTGLLLRPNNYRVRAILRI
ncbi:unnamed protein product [Owenia fusiformis]|uniref:Uncharacterized protein n=1 Tax=Owenia fusiformis TaxID=6347 RepID=A0A8J1Y679_OWEFU|nr:unnamed protein product [Owenia fusiformis]